MVVTAVPSTSDGPQLRDMAAGSAVATKRKKLASMSEEVPEDSASTASDEDATLKHVEVFMEEPPTLRRDDSADDDIPVMPSAAHGKDDTDADAVHAHDYLEKIDSKDVHRSSGKIALRRSTTTAIPKSFVGRLDAEMNEHSDDDGPATPTPLTRSKSVPERAAAMEAIHERATMFRYALSSRNARESVRQMYSFLHNKFPHDCHQSTDAQLKMGPVWRNVHLEINREGLTCNRVSLVRKKKKPKLLANDDILGAARVGETTEVVVHYMKQGRGKNEEKLMRRYRQLHVRFADVIDTERCVRALQLLVKWDARVPLHRTRKIKVVVNPHSGKRKGLQIWETWKPVFELAGIQCDMETTQYSGHARDIGKTFELSQKYEAIVFVGGDGTVNEFMNGVFSREEDVWRHLVATTPVSLLCAGTDNAFGLGVGIPTHEAAVFCIVKRKIRPLDVLTCQSQDSDGTTRREFACCGVSFGIGSDIAVESEQTRWLGVYRYLWLKVKRGVFAPRPHVATVKYVLSDTVGKDPITGDQLLQTYYAIEDKNAEDQHHVELCSVYDDEHSEKRWTGDAESIYHPASEDRFGDQWKSEHHDYNTVGASNVYFETAFYHPSDGNMDLIIARRGAILPSIEVGLKYIFGGYLGCELVDYFKVKAMVIEQEAPDPINVDGEVFAGPGPFRIEVVPQLLCVLSEK